MKTIIPFLIILIFLDSNAYAQGKLYYNYKTKQIEDAAGANITQLKRGAKYSLAVKGYNPVLYKVQATVKQKDSFVEGLTTIMNFISAGTIVMPSGHGLVAAADHTDAKQALMDDYKKALELSIYLEDTDIDCATLRSKVLNKNELFESYYTYWGKGTVYTTANKLDDDLKITLDNVIRLNNMSNEMIKFSAAANNCATELIQFTPTKTEVTLEVQLTPVDEKSSLNAIKFSNTLSVKGRLYASFSTGILATNVVKKSYYTKEISATEFTIAEENKANMLPGVMGLIHISPKEDSILSFNVGIGLDIDKTPHFLTGLSLNLFKSTFLLNAGYDLGYLDEITDKYNTKDNYAIKPELGYKKNLVEGFWIGLTYKL